MSLEEKTKESNNKKVVGVIVFVLVIIGLVIGYSVFNKQISKTDVDVFAGVEIKFEGIDGEGVATYSRDNVVKTEDPKLNTFLSNVGFLFDSDGPVRNGSLSNGSKIKVMATPNAQMLDEFNFKVDQLEKVYEVSGLNTIPKDYTEISNIDEINDQILLEFKNDTKPILSSTTKEYTLVKSCYTSTPDNADSYLTLRYGTYLQIYKVDETNTVLFTDRKETTTSYYGRGYTNISVLDNKADLSTFEKYNVSSESDLDSMINRVGKFGLTCK